MAGISACRPDSPAASARDKSVTIYCSVDEEFARPLLAEFEKQSGIRVDAQFDTEAGKTTGLIERLRAERHRPRADVFWSSEVFGTIALANLGVFAPAPAESAAGIPSAYRDAENRWTAFALRGRVLAYDPKRTADNSIPRRWADLSDPRFKGRLVMANPQFGTTRGHMAALLCAWGEPAFKAWLTALHANEVRLADGNAQAAMLVVRGQADIGMTDTDDVYAAQHRGDSIAMSSPDFDKPGGPRIAGTLWIPNSAALIAAAPHPDEALQLLAFVCSAIVEERLARSESGNVPVRPALRDRLQMPPPAAAVIDYTAAAALMSRSDELSREILSR